MNSTDVKIRALYAGAAADEHNDFRPHALRQVCEYFGAKAAAWVTHSEGGTVGEFSVFPRNLAASAEHLSQLTIKDGGPTALPAEHSRPNGLGFRHQHLDTRLTRTVTFWFAASKKFSAPAAAAATLLLRRRRCAAAAASAPLLTRPRAAVPAALRHPDHRRRGRRLRHLRHVRRRARARRR